MLVFAFVVFKKECCQIEPQVSGSFGPDEDARLHWG